MTDAALETVEIYEVKIDNDVDAEIKGRLKSRTLWSADT
jgi:hypothetical protein